MASAKLQHRGLSILVGILAGILLAVFASSTPVTNLSLVDLVIFLTIPSLAGALAGFSDPKHSVGNGVLVGIVVGLAYVIMAAVRLTSLIPANIVLFLILSVPIWGFLGGAGAMFVHRASTINQHSLPASSASPVSKLCASCSVSNPPDALFCKNCGSKLP